MTEYITVRGFVATAPESKTLEDGTALASFRLASTPRWFDAKTGTWTDGSTNWYTVVGFRALAASITLCVEVGQPLLVQGRLKVKNWEVQGVKRSTVEIEAVSLGHDLAFGTSRFTRSSNGQRAGGEPAQDSGWPSAGEAASGQGAAGQQDLAAEEEQDEAFAAMT